MNSQEWLESKSYEAIRGMSKVGAVLLEDALVALEIKDLEADIECLDYVLDLVYVKEGGGLWNTLVEKKDQCEKQLSELKKKHNIL